MCPETQPGYAHEIAHTVLPEVEPDDHQHGADQPEDNEDPPGDGRSLRTRILRPHVPHQPDHEHTERVTDRTRSSAHQCLEQRAARQQRRCHRQPKKDQANCGTGEGVLPHPPSGPRGLRCGGWCCFLLLVLVLVDIPVNRHCHTLLDAASLSVHGAWPSRHRTGVLPDRRRGGPWPYYRTAGVPNPTAQIPASSRGSPPQRTGREREPSIPPRSCGILPTCYQGLQR